MQMSVVEAPVPEDERPGPRAEPDICVILNQSSGKKKDADILGAMQARFDTHPGRFTLLKVGKGAELSAAVDRAIDGGYPVIMAAGGDGTICAIASRLVHTDRTLAVLPLGTFNYFARGLGLPENVDEAIDYAVTGSPRPVTVGEVNGRIFLNNASLGVYPAILQQREGTYRRWGRSRLAAHWSVLVTFFKFHRSLSLRVTVDGRQIRTRTPLAFVARSAYQLEQFGLDGSDCIRDGRFALFLARDGNRLDLLIYAIRLAWGHMVQGRDFDLACGEDIVIETRHKRRLVARDGERERLASPFRFKIHKDALQVIAPPQSNGA